MRRLTRGSLFAAIAGAVLACTCFAVPAQATEVSDGAGFVAALSSNDGTIDLKGDITVSDANLNGAPLSVNHSVTINGNGNTLTNATTSTGGAGERNGLNIVGEGVQVTVHDLTIVDNNGSSLTVQQGANAVLEGVTLDHSSSSYGCALIISDGSDVKMNGCTIKLGASSWGGVNIEGSGTVALGGPAVSGDTGKALVYVDNPASGGDITAYVKDVEYGSYVVGPITDGQNKPALVSSVWTVNSQKEFQTALDNAPADMTIKLGSDISVTDNGLYAANKKNLIIDGNNHTITATGLANGAHGGADRAALTLASSEGSQITNLKVVNESGENNNGINIWGGSAKLANVTLNHAANGGAPVIVAAGANVTVDGGFNATIGANSWGVVNVDTTGGQSKLAFADTVAATFNVTANPDAPVIYIDTDNNTPLDTVVSGEENAGLTFAEDGTAVKLPVLTFVIDGEVVTTIAASAEGKVDFTPVWSVIDDITPEGKQFDGWYADEKCTELFEGNTPVTEDTTLYGRWIDETGQIIEITFMNGDEVHTTAQIFAGETLAGVKVPDPVWEGHTFVGWYAQVNEDGTVVESSKIDLEKTVFMTSATLHAGFVTDGSEEPVTSDAEKPAGLPKTSDPTAVAPLVASVVAGIGVVAGAVALRRRSK